MNTGQIPIPALAIPERYRVAVANYRNEITDGALHSQYPDVNLAWQGPNVPFTMNGHELSLPYFTVAYRRKGDHVAVLVPRGIVDTPPDQRLRSFKSYYHKPSLTDILADAGKMVFAIALANVGSVYDFFSLMEKVETEQVLQQNKGLVKTVSEALADVFHHRIMHRHAKQDAPMRFMPYEQRKFR